MSLKRVLAIAALIAIVVAIVRRRSHEREMERRFGSEEHAVAA